MVFWAIFANKWEKCHKIFPIDAFDEKIEILINENILYTINIFFPLTGAYFKVNQGKLGDNLKMALVSIYVCCTCSFSY